MFIILGKTYRNDKTHQFCTCLKSGTPKCRCLSGYVLNKQKTCESKFNITMNDLPGQKNNQRLKNNRAE